MMSQPVLQSTSLNSISSPDFTGNLAKSSAFFGSQLRLLEIKRTHLGSATSLQGSASKLKAVREPLGFALTEKECDVFSQMKHRFLTFKKDIYLENLEHFQNLATGQSPKFMVIACADSRVCPSSILGFQPGEAFVVRNVANLVPPCQNGPSETNAALEFAVNSLEVENILVIGHSCCGGIRALMSMQDDNGSSSFISEWVRVGKPARLSTKAASSNLEFDQQCRHCEKESINRSLLNLLTYPWIEERVRKGKVAIHGGYYDFVNCTFEKWTLVYEESHAKVNDEHSVKNREFWQLVVSYRIY